MGALSLLGFLILAVAWDWLGVTRVAAYFTDFDYRYWPLSRPRQIGLTALLAAVAYSWLLSGTNRPVLLLVPCMLLIAIWGVSAVRDVNAQHRVGFQEPPRYSDGDY